ncbi:MAG TPA: alpha/beta hydrolase [Alphaproteobacteria bacterium]|nr:alpha/beta hydrolase [Alphaproteobacteria bacterium]
MTEYRSIFKGFREQILDIDGINIRIRHGGSGPPLLLLHGNPQTLCMWHAVAERLAGRFTVVAADLRGYGDSGKPATTADHAPYSKRAMAADQVAVMRQLGYPEFFVAGHDRGGRVAYRMAFDHPACVKKLAVLDIVPTLAAFNRADAEFALGYYHWFFLAQPFDLPERLIGADPEYFWRRHTTRGRTDMFAPEALADYLRCFRDPATIHGICEDYRAAASIDREHDRADLGHRKIGCPVLALWGQKGKLDRWYDVLAVWREWADDVRGRSLACGHYLAEEMPDETAAELGRFFAG